MVFSVHSLHKIVTVKLTFHLLWMSSGDEKLENVFCLLLFIDLLWRFLAYCNSFRSTEVSPALAICSFPISISLLLICISYGESKAWKVGPGVIFMTSKAPLAPNPLLYTFTRLFPLISAPFSKGLFIYMMSADFVVPEPPWCLCVI